MVEQPGMDSTLICRGFFLLNFAVIFSRRGSLCARNIVLALCACILVLTSNMTWSEELADSDTLEVSEHVVKAAFLVRFLEVFDFIGKRRVRVTYLGDEEAQLRSINDAFKQNGVRRKVELKKTKDWTEAVDSDFVLVEPNYNTSVSVLFKNTIKRKIIIITDDYQKPIDTMINFRRVAGKITFEVNRANFLFKEIPIGKDILLIGGTELDILELYKQLDQTYVQVKGRVEQYQNIIARNEDSLRAQKIEINSLNDSIGDLQEELSYQLDQLRETATESNRLRKIIEEKNQELEQVAESLRKKEEESYHLSANIQQQVEKISAYSEKIKGYEKDLEDLNEQISQKQMNIDRQEERLKLLGKNVNAQRSVLHLLLLLFVVLIVLFYISFRYVRQKRAADQLLITAKQEEVEQQKIKAELAMLKAQIKPHFLFNTLNAIQNAISEDPDHAESILVDLADVFRVTLQLSKKEVHTIDEELKLISSYLNIEKARFSDRFEYEVSCEEQCKQWTLPVLSIQPLVENAVKYAVADTLRKGVVEVKVESQSSQLLVEVMDNGSDENMTNKELKGFGVATKNIRARLKTLFGEEASLEIVNRGDEGTSAVLKLPRQAA